MKGPLFILVLRESVRHSFTIMNQQFSYEENKPENSFQTVTLQKNVDISTLLYVDSFDLIARF